MELHQRLLLSALLCLTGTARAADFEQLSRLSGQGARVTALVWDLDNDSTTASLAPTQRIIPASLSKIVVAAGALQTWPPDHTFPTELRSQQRPVDGTLAGDLILRGNGDATLDETTLWSLAAQLRGQGILRVRGRVLVERAPFGELACDTVDRCTALRRSSRAYNAAPSAIGVNYGSWCIAVRAPAGATTAAVGGCASGELPIPLRGTVQVAAGARSLTVERTTDSNGDAIHVSGTIAPGTDTTVHRAMSDPVAGAGLILRRILQQTGITVEGGVETTTRASPEPAWVLAKVDGLLLQEQVNRMMRWSNNYIADVLTMNLALSQSGKAPATLADAGRSLTRFIPPADSKPGVETGSPIMESGSGLTTTNRLSARDLVAVLRDQYRDSRRFPAFYGGFVVPRDAAFLYLQSGSADWQDRVALKTGSLSEPYSVMGVAGYLRKKNSGWMAFAILVNGSDKLPQIARDRALGALRADLDTLLQKN